MELRKQKKVSHVYDDGDILDEAEGRQSFFHSKKLPKWTQYTNPFTTVVYNRILTGMYICMYYVIYVCISQIIHSSHHNNI